MGLLGDLVGTDIDLSGKLATTANMFYYFIIFLIFCGVIGIAVYFWYDRKQYNKTIEIFEEINGIPMKVGTDKAREVILPHTSVRAFVLYKRGFYLPRPSIQTGINNYWYFVRDDGEWLNIGLTNLNSELTKLGIKYDHTDMRFSNASVKKLVEKNYLKTKWWKEYAPYIGFGIIILLLGVAAFLVTRDLGGVLSGLQSNLAEQAKVTESLGKLAEAIANLKGGSSGLVSAG